MAPACAGTTPENAAWLELHLLDSSPPWLDKPAHTIKRQRAAMSHADLAKTIDDAFEKRDGIGPSTKGAVREAVEAALDLLDRGDGARRRARRQRRLVGQPVAQEGGAAVVPAQRHERDPGRPGQGGVVGQGRLQIRRLGREPLPRGRLPRGARLRRAALRLYRAGRGADALASSISAPMSTTAP